MFLKIPDLLIVKKPPLYSSYEIIRRIKQFFKIYYIKIGHCGTLDLAAEGILIILLKKWTKIALFFLNMEKEYLFQIKLFVETDSLDLDGKIVRTESKKVLDLIKIKSVIRNFNNFVYWQRVPFFSAKKSKGVPLYKYARKGIEIKIPAKLVWIKKLKFINHENDSLLLKAVVSKGTYIRMLAKDIVNKLGILGTVSYLERLRQGNIFWKTSFQKKIIKIGSKIKIIPFKLEEFISEFNNNNFYLYKLNIKVDYLFFENSNERFIPRKIKLIEKNLFVSNYLLTKLKLTDKKGREINFLVLYQHFRKKFFFLQKVITKNFLF